MDNFIPKGTIIAWIPPPENIHGNTIVAPPGWELWNTGTSKYFIGTTKPEDLKKNGHDSNSSASNTTGYALKSNTSPPSHYSVKLGMEAAGAPTNAPEVVVVDAPPSTWSFDPAKYITYVEHYHDLPTAWVVYLKKL